MGLVLLAALVLGQLVTIEKLANPLKKKTTSLYQPKRTNIHMLLQFIEVLALLAKLLLESEEPSGW